MAAGVDALGMHFLQYWLFFLLILCDELFSLNPFL